MDQYRSVLFPQPQAQAKTAHAYLVRLGAAHVFARPIMTKLETSSGFFPAEAYHQDFMARNPTYPSIVINDQPKVDALRRTFPQSYRG